MSLGCYEEEVNEGYDENNYEASHSRNDNVLFLIDARCSMLEPVPPTMPTTPPAHGGGCIKHEERSNRVAVTYFEVALHVLASVMRHKIVLNDRHSLGILLFGTSQSTDSTGIEDGVYHLLELSAPSSGSIKMIDQLVGHMKMRGRDAFDERFGPGENSTPRKCLRAALYACMHIFNKRVKNNKDWKRVFIITNNDSPCNGDEDEQNRLVQPPKVARDASETGVIFILCPLSPPNGRSFSQHRFYQRIIPVDDGGADYKSTTTLAKEPATADVNELLLRVRRKEFVKRRLARLPLRIYTCSRDTAQTNLHGLPEIGIGVQVFLMTHHTTVPYPEYVCHNQVLQLRTVMCKKGTTEVVDVLDIHHYLEVGNTCIELSEEEMMKIKGAGEEPGIDLLGFRPKTECIRPDAVIRSAYFLYPDEESNCAAFIAPNLVLTPSGYEIYCNFNSPFRELLKKGWGGVVRFTRAAGAIPVLCALLPQVEELDASTMHQVFPPGFHLVQLPYKDEIREPPPPSAVPSANGAQVAPFLELVDKIQLQCVTCRVPFQAVDFDCYSYENPALQKHYAGVEAIALGQSKLGWSDILDDTTQPDVCAIDSGVSSIVECIKDVCGCCEGTTKEG